MPTPGELIDDLIAGTPDWRGEVLVGLRRLILDADPQMSEEWKWVSPNRPGTPVWARNGNVCHVNILKAKVKLTLHAGASLDDPHKLFNAGLEGNRIRAIDIYEGDEIDEGALGTLIRAGVDHNLAKAKSGRRR